MKEYYDKILKLARDLYDSSGVDSEEMLELRASMVRSLPQSVRDENGLGGFNMGTQSLPVKFLPNDTIFFMVGSRVCQSTVHSVEISKYSDGSGHDVYTPDMYVEGNHLKLRSDDVFATLEELTAVLQDNVFSGESLAK